MKGRTQAPSSCESEDWGEESWTVDCPCGVNFDDGEEMVDCDECGVWVHTSCCRILKGHTSYVCDKCKSKKKKKESEETEVAQLLVELPSKTAAFEEKIMEKSDFYPFRTADISMDERAHVQGIPGGDSRLFVGVSQVFSPQLWKCTGYVPKMLRFEYHELPEWSNEKVSPTTLFADAVDKSLDTVASGSLKKELLSIVEEDGPSEADLLQSLGAQMETNQVVKERHSKRDLRKESKHRLRVHGLKEEKGQSSKRRRDDSGKKDTSSRKRSTSSMDCYQGNEEIAKNNSKDPRAMRKFAVQNFLDAVDEVTTCNSDLKVEVAAIPESFGPTVRDSGSGKPEISVNHEFSKPLDSLKNSNRDNLAEEGSEERDGLGGQLLSPTAAHRSNIDSVHRQEEAQHHPKDLEGPTASKATSPAGVALDTFSSKDHRASDTNPDVKIAPADPTEIHHQRLKCTLLVSTKQLEDVMHEQTDPNAGNGKSLQESLHMSPQTHPVQEPSVQAAKHISNEDTICPVKQQSVSQNQLPSTEIQNHQQVHIFKHPEQSREKAVKSSHQRHSSTSDASHLSDDEQIEPYNQVNEHTVEGPSLISVDRTYEQSPSQDEHHVEEKTLKSKGHDQDQGVPSSPAEQAFQQGGNVLPRIRSSVSANAAGHLRAMVEDNSSTSPLSTQTIPLKSSNLNLSSSPTSSCPSVGFKHQGVAKFNSVSPPSEKTGNVALPQPGATSKPIVTSSAISNNKSHSSSIAKLGNSPGNLPSKDAKHRSKTNSSDSRKADAVNTVSSASVASPAEGHAAEGMISSSRHPSKESGKNLVDNGEKVTVLGKSSSVACPAKVPSHSKSHSTLVLAKQTDQLSPASQSQTLPQTKPVKPGSKSMPHKTEKSAMISGPSALKASTVLLPPHPTGTPDRQLPSTNFGPPTLNDEELALLLHQELNSSPRVPRVAKIRQAVTASPHLSVVQTSYHSSKRPASTAVPAAPSSSQKDHHTISRRRMRDDSSRENPHGTDDASKVDASGNKKQDNTATYLGKKREKDADGGNVQKANIMTSVEISSHLSQGLGNLEGQSTSDLSCATASNDGDRRGSADNVLTLPGLIEEILNEKGHQASYNFICEAVLPHWPKLRKHNGERYAYTSHRQAVLDCLRNRSAWSHLIDRGPKTNVGRKRRRTESVVAVESENVEEADGRAISHDDEGEDSKPGRSPKENEVVGNETWPPSDSGKDIDSTLPEEVPKGKRKARQRRRLAVQARGYGARNLQNREDKTTETTTVSEEDHDQALSPLSEEATSNYSEEEEEILVHRGGRHIGRRQGSSVDSGDDEMGM